MDSTAQRFPHPKPRPRAWWFVLGVVLILGSVVAGGLLFYRTFDGFFTVEARVAADDTPHRVDVGTDGPRFLWVGEYGSADCAIVDADRGGEISVGAVNGTFSRTGGSGSWVAEGVFDPGSGALTVTCASTGYPVEIGPAVVVRDFVTSLLLAILVPMLLFGLGTVILIVTGILWVLRPARA